MLVRYSKSYARKQKEHTVGVYKCQSDLPGATCFQLQQMYLHSWRVSSAEHCTMLWQTHTAAESH